MGDPWATAANYEDFMGRWSRRIAPRFVSWLPAPRGLDWLDVRCGTTVFASFDDYWRPFLGGNG